MEKDYFDGTVVFEEDGYTLTEVPGIDGMSTYIVYDDIGNYLDEFEEISLSDDEKDNFRDTYVYSVFRDVIESFNFTDSGPFFFFGDEGSYPKHDVKSLSPEEMAAKLESEKPIVEGLCKSDTIVFHQEDPTTVMLNPIYEGRGWDVYKGSEWSGPLSRESLDELMRRHDRILFLGHGTPGGLMSGVVGREQVPLLKGKKVFALWCYAATFLKNNGLHGFMCSDNCPSEVWECKAACDADVSKEWIYDNMLYLSEVLKDVVELSFTDPHKAVDIARDRYSKAEASTEDEKKVVEFNTNTLQVS